MCRPEKPIDWQRVDELLEAGCLGTEIAAHYNMNQHTFYDRVFKKYNMTFTAYSCEKKYKGDSLIREAQFKKALKKMDNTMLIWLGKQRLGQKDNKEGIQFTEESIQPLRALMDQISSCQEERKIKEISPSTEDKSE